eukprot:CAMPEP_0206320262 /NCGR_PEP_ID=MMETSP0106_2-20121207/18220_1 /ASSEMBLY_ACC=CAM_ASM_000206 /TAXON_ID=81532 /ORGANISM="Acanthoeca-like sp., Strain 10tr" /LENGTH=595 /DNA_ID=CAMNT_0053752199 /DNA_START=132 /DNA_END=1919 /DNA_ORIENTATION=+
MIYMFLGTSKDVTLGPTAIMSKITAENAETEHWCGKGGDETDCDRVTHNAVLLCLFGGMLNLLMGLLHLGFVIDFISYPVLTGFTTSAALTIAWGQVHSLLGISSSVVRRQFQFSVYDVFNHLHLTKYPDVLMSVICILLTIGCQKLKRRMEVKKNRNVVQNALWFIGAAGNFFVVLFGIIVVKIFQSTSDDIVCNKAKHVTMHCLTDEGTIPAGLKLGHVPAVTGADVSKLAVGAVLVALIGYLESVAIASAFARSNGYEINTTQELVAIGCSNIVSFFVQAYPVTGSFSRTAVNSATGVATPTAAGLVTGSIVLISIQFLTPIMQYISKASLGSIIIVSVLKMFNWRRLPLQLWQVSKIDLVPWAISFFGCTFLGIEYGVGVGAVANMLILVYFTARPNHIVRWKDQKGPRPLNAITEEEGIGGYDAATLSDQPSATNAAKVVVCQIGGSLLYPVGKTWKRVLEEALASASCTSVVLDFSNVPRIDYTGVQALREAVEDCRKAGAHVHLANVGPVTNAVLRRADFWDRMRIDEIAARQTVDSALIATEKDDFFNPDPSLTATLGGDEKQPLLSRRSPSGGPDAFGDAAEKSIQ